MNLLVADDFRHEAAPATSGDGVLHRARDWVIRVSGALSVQGTVAAESQSPWAGKLVAAEQTNSGLTAIDEITEPSAAIAELRRRSGLTWDQLARIFGVARRSVHFWVSGKPMNAANEERLGRLLVVVRHIDRGTAQATRAAIMNALPDGLIPFELLLKDEFDEVMERLGPGPQRAMPTSPPLSVATQVARTPPPTDERVGALQDTVHKEVGRSRAARAVRIKSKR